MGDVEKIEVYSLMEKEGKKRSRPEGKDKKGERGVGQGTNLKKIGRWKTMVGRIEGKIQKTRGGSIKKMKGGTDRGKESAESFRKNWSLVYICT